MVKPNGMRFPLKFKISIIVTTLSLMSCIVSIIMSSYRVSSVNEQSFKNQSKDIANMAVLNIDGDALKVLRDSVQEVYSKIPTEELVISDDWGSDEFNAFLEKFSFVYDMPEFKIIHDQLSSTQDLGISTLASIYTIFYDFDRDIPYAIYLVDAAVDDNCPPGVVEQVTDIDLTGTYGDDRGTLPYITNMDLYGWLVTAASPVYDSDGNVAGYLAVDLDMNDIKSNEVSFIVILTLILVALTAVSAVITIIVIRKTIVDPIKTLSTAAMQYISGKKDKDQFSLINIKSSDEIGDLSNAMKKMESDINDYVNNITSMTSEKERISAELNIAAKMQLDMLPKTFPDRDDIEIFATMRPAREMGGDFYDFFMIDDDHIGLVMADVSGKGVPAAMFMIIVKTLIKKRSTASGSPSQILHDVNNTLCADNPSELFVTAWLGILTISSGELISANAGHEYPVLMHANEEYKLLVDNNMPPLAAMENIAYKDKIRKLQKGDRLFLYTDGVPEAKSPDGKRFGIDKMLEILNREKDRTPKEILGAMQKEIDTFSGTPNDLFDDVTMMSIVWDGK